MKSTPRLIVFHPSFYKPTTTTTSSTATPRLYLLAFFSLFTFTFLLTLLKPISSPHPPTPSSLPSTALSPTVSAALLHYATTPTTTPRMSPSELITIASTLLRHCHPNCNLLVFGFSHESLLWHSLNSPSPRRTVFLDENQNLVNSYERNFTDIEAYDVDYTTKVTQSDELIQYSRAHRASHCKPVQNLLFSDCKLAVNDLPNHLYSIPWDIIIVDGPRGYSGKMPGRMSPIFTAAVLARTPTPAAEVGTQRKTHVFVHDYGREVEKVYSEEFLCKENLVEVKNDLAHFVVNERALEDDLGFHFCTGENSSSWV